MKNVTERFLEYVKYDTTSKYESGTLVVVGLVEKYEYMLLQVVLNLSMSVGFTVTVRRTPDGSVDGKVPRSIAVGIPSFIEMI